MEAAIAGLLEMAGGSEGAAVPPPQGAVAAKPKKRNPAPGVRAVGGRIYDSENGKTCHQCRQKTRDFAASCKEIKKKGQCPIKYCHKCLLNRYGENAEDVALKKDWTCPKCRGICNCSFCRKKKGETPTGILAHAAKASGCTSVHELLNKGSNAVAAAQMLRPSPMKVNVTEKKGNPKRPLGTEDAVDESLDEGNENIRFDLNALPSVRTKKRLKGTCRVNNSSAGTEFLLESKGEPLLKDRSLHAPENKIMLPSGTPVTSVAGVKLEDEDVGAAIQFYEFCRTFAEVLQIRKGQPQKVLQDIFGGRELRVVSSFIAELHITLLSVIQEDRGEKTLNYSRDEDAWVIDVGKYCNKSKNISKELCVDYLNQGLMGYKNLSPSCKLSVLNSLCDETVSTAKLRNLIQKQYEMAAERKSATIEKIRVANEQEKELKERLKNSMNKALLLKGGKHPTIEETNNLISQIKEAKEVRQAAVNEKKLGCVLRTKPIMIDKGLAYWNLDGYCNNTAIMLQVFDDEDLMGAKDKWFMFTEDEEMVLKDHVATRSQRRWKKHARL